MTHRCVMSSGYSNYQGGDPAYTPVIASMTMIWLILYGCQDSCFPCFQAERAAERLVLQTTRRLLPSSVSTNAL